MEIPAITALNGTLIRHADGWYWRDGKPAPVRDERLAYFAPSFRCITYGGGRTFVEIPHNWKAKHRWDGSEQVQDAIAELIEQCGKPAPVYAEGLAELTDEHRLTKKGYLIPVEQWDSVMSEPVGVSWDREREPEILARAEQLNE